MAEGGVALRATRRVIGERGPEAVIPLHKMAQLGVGGGGVTVNVSVNSGGSPQAIADAAGAAARAETLRVLTESGAGRNAVRRATRGIR